MALENALVEETKFENYVEFYHNLERYQICGLDNLLDHISDYFRGIRPIPISKSNSISGNSEVLFVFSEYLMKKLSTNNRLSRKSYEVAIKYGFRGHSNGGINGIFFQRSTDQRMIAETSRLMRKHKNEIVNLLEVSEKNFESLEKIKVVCHNPCGERVVGVYNPENNKMIFLGFAHY